MRARDRRAHRPRLLVAAGGLIAAAALSGCGGSTPLRPVRAAGSPPRGATVIRAGGTDYAAPVYQEISSELQSREIWLNYQLSTPAGALSRLRTGTAALAALEGSRSLGDLPRVRNTSELYVPVAFGAVSMIYNLPGVTAPLQLRAGTLADIYLGRLQRWNAREIRRDNPGVTLPSTLISVVHRSDPAVSTDLLTQYLASGSRRWRHNPGAGADISWPAGTAVSSDDSMRQIVGDTPGAIGYTDQATALQNRLRSAHLRNPAGAYVAPTLRATSAAGRQATRSGSLSLSTINAPDPDAYPVVAESYVLTYRDLCAAGLSAGEASAVQQLVRYVIGPGQMTVRRFSLAPLPPALRTQARSVVRQMRCGDETG